MYKVVIVDDNIAAVEMIATMISWDTLNCSVVGVAYDGARGQALIIAQKPDIIISDIHMPGLDGLKMIETTKNSSPHSRVIFVSAYDDFNYAKKALSLHASEYLLKPFRSSELMQCVMQVIEEIQVASPMISPSTIAGNSQKTDNLTVNHMLEYVRVHISSPLTLATLSQHFGLCPSYISTLIKKETGKKFTDWVVDLRIEFAKQLLKDPLHNVQEIANLVGYNHYVTFYNLFVKNVGMPPTAYRKQMAGDNDREDRA